MKKIGMVAAMTSELNALLEKLNAERISDFGGKSVLFARAGGKELYILESGVGEILAAAGTQHLISAYGAEVIINFGVCGSLDPRHALQSTVLVSGVIHYEMDTSAVDGTEAGRYFFLPSAVIPTDAGLLSLAKKAAPSIECVLCASGNKFIADEREKTELYEKFGAEVCEMEAAGIALACLNSSVPCLIVKAVSDGGDAGDYEANLHAAERAYIDLLLGLLEVL